MPSEVTTWFGHIDKVGKTKTKRKPRWKNRLAKLLCSFEKLPQITGALHHTDSDGKYDGVCAMGALAMEAGMSGSPDYGDIVHHYGYSEYLDTSIACRKCGEETKHVSSHIVHLNDAHNMTFGEIATEINRVEIPRLHK